MDNVDEECSFVVNAYKSFQFYFHVQFCERNNGTRDSPEQCQICKLMKYLVFICLFFNLFKPKWIGVSIDNGADVHLQ